MHDDDDDDDDDDGNGTTAREVGKLFSTAWSMRLAARMSLTYFGLWYATGASATETTKPPLPRL